MADARAAGLNLLQMFEARKPASLKRCTSSGRIPSPATASIRLRISQSLVVVQDMFLPKPRRLADVVLPAANAYEKSGTFTNTCGDLQILKKAGEFSGAKSDFEMIVRIADAMGFDVRNWFPSAAALMPIWASRAAPSPAKPIVMPYGSGHGLEPQDVAL